MGSAFGRAKIFRDPWKAKLTIAGGVETVSDVQIKHSPEMRQELIKSQKYKSNMGERSSLFH